MSAIKLLMSWDIQPGREEDYFEFHIRKFVPALEGLGVALSEAWLTVYGEQPRLLAEAVIPTIDSARQVLGSSAWQDLGLQMEDLVDNFNYKLVPARGGFQM